MFMAYSWQQPQWQKVQQQRQAGKLPHAILLVGPEGLGKRHFSTKLANSLLCQSPSESGEACGQCAACKLLEVGTHPDLFVLQAEERGKAIKVDSIRQLSTDLNLTSQYAGYKVAIIADAHDMNINASNSLLKTLEEPASDSVLILVSSNPQKLPITVRSRCQMISFNMPEKSEALSWLSEQGIDEADELLALAHGAPLLAKDLKNEDILSYHKQLVTALLGTAKNQPVVEQAEQLHKFPQAYLLNWLYDWVQDMIRLHQCGDSASLVHERNKNELLQLTARSNLQGLYDYLDQLTQTKRLQSIPLNTQLLWEDLLLSWNKLLKRV